MKIYLDSCVFISLIRSEIGKHFRMLFQDSELLFAICKQEGIELILSELFFAEVEKVIGLEQKAVLEFMQEYGVIFTTVPKDKADKIKAKEIQRKTGLHLADSLHVALAVKAQADLIVSWNIKDFEKAGRIARCKTPSDFIGWYH